MEIIIARMRELAAILRQASHMGDIVTVSAAAEDLHALSHHLEERVRTPAPPPEHEVED